MSIENKTLSTQQTEDERAILAVVDAVIFNNPENHYTVLSCEREQRGSALYFVAVGILPGVAPGMTLALEGKWTHHPTHGDQFQVESFEQSMPTTNAGLMEYLASGMVRGIGPALAHAIVQKFGENTIEVLDTDPEQLLTVSGIGRRNLQTIVEDWTAHRAMQRVMTDLFQFGISPAYAGRIVAQYGERALQVIRDNPYQLILDVRGIGFKTADEIAQAVGIARNSAHRIQAGMMHLLFEASGDGHVFLYRQELVRDTAVLLGLSPAEVDTQLPMMDFQGYIQVVSETYGADDEEPEDKRVYLAGLYHAETGIARHVARLMNADESRLGDLARQEIHPVTEAGHPLTETQTQAVRNAALYPVSVITGGPGTGKTSCLKALVSLARGNKVSLELASPTGRAAKRLAEATSYPASTIHRLLGILPDQDEYEYTEGNPIPADLLIIDEASMLDVNLAHLLVRAVATGAHIVFVGDADQLPSVGPGDVLRDLIRSRQIPVTVLSQVFRQAEGSQIVENAHRINRGESLELNAGNGEEFFFFSADDGPQGAELVVDLVSKRIPERFGLRPEEIQVLAPMYRGNLGIDSLNAALRDCLNPPGPTKTERAFGSRIFRVGDRVLVTKNNHGLEVYNGDIGVVVAIQNEHNTLSIALVDGKLVDFPFKNIDQLTHGYCVSIHKSQGSEWPAVLVVTHTSHYIMLSRNLLYTGVTRAQKLAVLVGNRRGVSRAVQNNAVARRNTTLAKMLPALL